MKEVTDEELEVFLNSKTNCEFCKKESLQRDLQTLECSCPDCDKPHFACWNCYSRYVN